MFVFYTKPMINLKPEKVLSLLSVLILVGVLALFERHGTDYQVRILNLIGINIILAVSFNLINGVAGQFSLAPNAFVALGAYTAALLTMTPEEKQISFIIEPLIWPLNQVSLPFPLALAAAGLVAAFFGFLLGFPVFRVKGDYLAIVTLGFGEVVRVGANNLQALTNGPLGLKGLSPLTSLGWSWGLALATVFLVVRLVKSSYGRAFKAVRQDEQAAAAMGINVFRHKMLAFTISAFFGGLAGGLLAHLITTISPSLFSFFLTFNLLIIIVVGGLGSTTGAVIAAVLITWAGEWLRWAEEPLGLGPLQVPGIPGMRMVIFSLVLLAVILFAREGIMGRREFSWGKVLCRWR
jgi:branched-chain amino acid transport system permease protein